MKAPGRDLDAGIQSDMQPPAARRSAERAPNSRGIWTVDGSRIRGLGIAMTGHLAPTDHMLGSLAAVGRTRVGQDRGGADRQHHGSSWPIPAQPAAPRGKQRHPLDACTAAVAAGYRPLAHRRRRAVARSRMTPGVTLAALAVERLDRAIR